MKTNCDKKTCLIAVVAVTLFMMGFGWLVHGQLLTADYEATSSLWRSDEEMQQFFPWCLIYQVALAALFVCLFKKFHAGYAACHPVDTAGATPTRCPVKSGGLCFGIKLGLILGLLKMGQYFYLPVPLDLGIKWFCTEFTMGLGIGIILGMIYGTKNNAACEVK